jgi:hypothetical protein
MASTMHHLPGLWCGVLHPHWGLVTAAAGGGCGSTKILGLLDVTKWHIIDFYRTVYGFYVNIYGKERENGNYRFE